MGKLPPYDLLFLTDSPSFYKINLYNSIAVIHRIYVIFLGNSTDYVINREVHKTCLFDHIIMDSCDLRERNRFINIFRVHKIINKIHYKKLLIYGYIYAEFVVQSILRPRKFNVLVTETGSETKLKGWKFLVKILLLKRFSAAVASGVIHSEMLRKMKFRQRVLISKGVGIINKREVKSSKEKVADILRFLYVGRLIEIKNIDFLIRQFNENGLPLTVIGDGPQYQFLRSIANDNIEFKGFIENDALFEYYQQHDVLVLPSKNEAWGIVVEEALYYGCVLLLSKTVGCINELLYAYETGESFEYNDEESFGIAIDKIITFYARYKVKADGFDIDQKDREQVFTYSKLLYNIFIPSLSSPILLSLSYVIQ